MLGSLAFIFCCCVAIEPAWSQPAVSFRQTDQKDSDTKKPKKPATNQKEKKQPVAEERVKVLLIFAGEHHPEILPLLKVLKKKRPARYERVIHGLDKEVRSLERIKQRSLKSYPAALEQWVNRSKIRLLTAQVSTSKSVEEVKKIRVQIRRLLKKNQETRLAILDRDLKEARLRVERLEKTANDLRANGDEAIEERVQTLTKLPAKLKKSLKKPTAKDKKRPESEPKSSSSEKKD